MTRKRKKTRSLAEFLADLPDIVADARIAVPPPKKRREILDILAASGRGAALAAFREYLQPLAAAGNVKAARLLRELDAGRLNGATRSSMADSRASYGCGTF